MRTTTMLMMLPVLMHDDAHDKGSMATGRNTHATIAPQSHTTTRKNEHAQAPEHERDEDAARRRRTRNQEENDEREEKANTEDTEETEHTTNTEKPYETTTVR